MTDSSKPLTFMSIRLVDMGVVWFCSYCYYAPADKVIKHKDCIYVGICRDCDMERLAVKGTLHEQRDNMQRAVGRPRLDRLPCQATHQRP